MLGITDLPAFLTITVITILLPGPNSLFVLSVAARQGLRDGYKAAAGVMVGDGLLMLLSVLGVATLMKTYPTLFLGLRLAGAGYLAWLGVGLIRAALRGWQQRHVPVAEQAAPVREARPFWRTLGICLTNPKAILFFMAFFIQFVDAGYPHPWLSFAVLGLMLQLISLSYLSVLIFAGHRLAAGFAARRRLAAGGTGLAGGLFLAFAGKLATATL